MIGRYTGINSKEGVARCAESTIIAARHALDEWMRQLPDPWIAGMEATLFTGWIHDHLVSGGTMVKVAHPAMPQAIAAGKKEERSGECGR